MYAKVKTHKKFENLSGEELKPIVTLQDNYGSICHIVRDDGCYVCYLNHSDIGFVQVVHIFPELHKALCELESPDKTMEIS